MSRRSSRLVAGIYNPGDDDGTSSSSTGSAGQVTYKESPVRIFKKKTGGRKFPSSRSSIHANGSSDAVSQYSTDEPVTTEEPWGSVNDSRKKYSSLATRSTDPSVYLSSASRLGSHIELQGHSSGYSSSEESSNPHTSSSAQSPAEPELKQKVSLKLPARTVAMLFWWLGTAWYSLTSGCSLLDVFLLSRWTAAVKKAVLFSLLLVLLAFGAWYWYPYLFGMSAEKHVFNAPTLDVKDAAVLPSLSALQEAFRAQLAETEARLLTERLRASETEARERESMQREVNLMKQEAEKLKHLSEMLRNEMSDLKSLVKSAQTEHRRQLVQEVSAIEKHINDLRADVSSLHTATDVLKQQVDSQQSADVKAELSQWLLQHLSSGDDSVDVVMRPELQRALEDLERRLLVQLTTDRAQERRDMWQSVGETLQGEGVGAVSVQDVQQIVRRALSLYRADDIGMADYALESSGASVINTRCSETYRTRSPCVSLFGVPLWYQSESPRTVIQPEMHPGKCWAFRGNEGFLVISLSYPVQVTHVTLEHLPKVLSPTGRIDSAPREFSIYGMNEEAEEGTLLGTFTYDQEGEPIQTFQLPKPEPTTFSMVELRILSNWGHPEYTCVYRFRVHGKPGGT